MTRVAVLDDYQRRAAEYANWASLGPASRWCSSMSPSARAL